MSGKIPAINKRYASLDVMRGMAALWVLMYHVRPSPALAEIAPWFARFCSYGELGVPAFFVISGYCITASARSAMRRDESAGRFMHRRLTRIFPPFWCSIIVVAAAPFVVELISSLKTGEFVSPNPAFMTYSALDWIGIATMTRVFFSHGEHLQQSFTQINAVYWTLAIEVQFYMVVALALAARKRYTQIIVAVTGGSLIALMLPMMFRTGLFLAWWPMFALGIVLYGLIERGYTPQQLFGKQAALISTMMLAGLMFVIIRYYHPHALLLEGQRFTIFGAWFALALWPMHTFDHAVDHFSQHRSAIVAGLGRLLLLLGAMSYSIYLLHGKLSWIGMQFARQIVSEDSPAFQMVVICLTLPMCYPFYYFCEKPFIRSSAQQYKS
jgi:peptidoglycan/LPS O-acetylase OafA/YrhL